MYQLLAVEKPRVGGCLKLSLTMVKIDNPKGFICNVNWWVVGNIFSTVLGDDYPIDLGVDRFLDLAQLSTHVGPPATASRI